MEKVSFSKGQEANVSGLWHQTEGTSREQPTIMLHEFETGAIASKNNNSLHTFIAINIEHGPVHRILLYLGWQTIS